MLPIGQVTQYDTLVSDTSLAAANWDRNPLCCLFTCLDIVRLYLWATCEEQKWESVCFVHVTFYKIASVLSVLFLELRIGEIVCQTEHVCKLTWINEVCDLNRASYLLPTPAWGHACARVCVTHLISSEEIPYIVQCRDIIAIKTTSGFE